MILAGRFGPSHQDHRLRAIRSRAMSPNRKQYLLKCCLVILISGLALAACSSPGPSTPNPTPLDPQGPAPTAAAVTTGPTPTASPTPAPPRTLVVCLGQEPDSLYPYAGRNDAAASVLEAIYDGPIDRRAYRFQPVILEKLPGLDEGDARLEPVSVQPGQAVVDASGILTTLQSGVRIFPAGCSDLSCVVEVGEAEPVEMDQLVVTFRLQPGLTWSDGAPLTASDSVFSFELDSHPDTPSSKFLIDRTAGYEALDELTVVWSGLPGFRDPTYFTNFWTPYPAHLWGSLSPGELLRSELATRNPVGWGPYIIEDWAAGESLRLRRNPRYFRSDEGLPVFDFLVFRFVGQNADLSVPQLLSGECDVLDRSVRLEAAVESLTALEAEGRLQLEIGPTLDWEHAAFGIVPASYDDGYQPGADRPDFFGDVRTRQAIARCMDRQGAVDTVLHGRTPVLDSYIPPDHPLYNTAIPRYEFDPVAAAALLEEVGWQDHDGDPATPRVARGVENVLDGTPLEFSYLSTEAPQRMQVAQILVDSLAQCGIRALLEFREPGEFYDSGPAGPLFGRQFDMGQFAWRIDTTPPCFLYLSEAIPGDPVVQDLEGNRRFIYGWGGWNLTGYRSEVFDAACRQARASLPGEESFEAAHREAQMIFASELPVVPLYLHLQVAATRPDFCHYELDPTEESGLMNIEEFEYGEGCGP